MAVHNWSVSSLSTIQDCGYKWKLQYQTKHLLPEEPRPEFAFGRTAHKVIELVHADGLFDMSQWLQIWDELWRHECARFSKDDIVVRARLRHYGKLGPELLLAYTGNELNRAANVKQGEWKFDVKLEGFPVRGVVDQIREEADGSLLVLDFKTSKEPLEELILRTDPQLSVYWAAVEAHFGVQPRVAQYHLRTGQIMETRRTARDVLAVVSMIREGQRRVDEDLLTRQLGHHCTLCPFKVPCLRSI